MATNVALIDPTGSFGLVAKYKKALDKGKLAGIRLDFTATGSAAMAALKPSTEGGELIWVPIAEAMASISAQAEEHPFADEKAHVVSKYEVRLDEEAPMELRNAATKAAMEAVIASLPFKKRRALQMSNREFELAFLRWEDGAPVARPAEQAEQLRQEHNSTRGGGNRGRGRGRGGRGRGSFLGASVAPKEGQNTGQNAE